MPKRTADEIRAQRSREMAAERKAAEAPNELTADDLLELRPSVLHDALTRGDLRHLGYGASSGHR